MKKVAVALLALILLPRLAHGATEVVNRDALRARYGLTSYPQGAATPLRIAVLDNGFLGYEPQHGLLPDSAELVAGPVNAQSPTNHGLGMAQIIWAMTGSRPEGPKFYLINSNGFSNFKAAIDFAISKQVDIILYAQVWPFGSNFDGTGFINTAVNRATSAGILWINAAGNYGGLVYSGKVARQTGSDGSLHFNQGLDYLRFDNTLDDNEVTVTLSWSDFQDSETYNTKKDLNLYVYDSNDKLIGSSELIQRGEAPVGDDSKLSSHAHESVDLHSLGRGSYRIRVKAVSNNFTARDLFKVALRSEKPGAVVFQDHSQGGEILPPADNANVITVGEHDPMSSVGPTADGREKPEVTLEDAVVAFSSGEQTRGSSNAAAIFTGIAATLKGYRSDLDFDWFSQRAASGRTSSNIQGLVPADPRFVNPVIFANVPQGGSVMMEPTTGRYIVVCPQDPLELPLFRNVGAHRNAPDDVLVADFVYNRWFAYPASQAWMIRVPLVEFRQLKQGGWVTPQPNEL